jgi:glucose/arabinose dehydrogenase
MKKRVVSLFIVSLMLLTACLPMNPSASMEITQPEMQETVAEALMEAATDELMETTETQEEIVTEPPEPFEPLVSLELVAEGFSAPVALASPDDGSGRSFVMDQIGLIRVIDAEGNLLETPFLDIRDQMVNLGAKYDERGLLGLAFHPNTAENGRFFVYYSAPLRPEGPQGWNHTSILSEFAVSESNENMADPDSEQVILQIDQPQANHNACSIVFDPDGYPYVPLGNGGGGKDNDAGHAKDWYEKNSGDTGSVYRIVAP